MITLVPPEELPNIWEQVKEHIPTAAETSVGRWTAANIVAAIQSGHQQLWVAFEGEDVKAICTTQIVSYPQMKALQGQFVAGVDLDAWMSDLLEVLEKFAVDNDCKRFEFMGRSGWERKLASFGPCVFRQVRLNYFVRAARR